MAALLKVTPRDGVFVRNAAVAQYARIRPALICHRLPGTGSQWHGHWHSAVPAISPIPPS